MRQELPVGSRGRAGLAGAALSPVAVEIGVDTIVYIVVVLVPDARDDRQPFAHVEFEHGVAGGHVLLQVEVVGDSEEVLRIGIAKKIVETPQKGLVEREDDVAGGPGIVLQAERGFVGQKIVDPQIGPSAGIDSGSPGDVAGEGVPGAVVPQVEKLVVELLVGTLFLVLPQLSPKFEGSTHLVAQTKGDRKVGEDRSDLFLVARVGVVCPR